jgi:D-alanyl-D-alanine carboxypeptidase (penicillin-binding protein 5/6)
MRRSGIISNTRRGKRRLAVLVASIAAVLLAGFSASAEPAASSGINYNRAPDVTAPSAILIDASSGQVLFEKNADSPRAPASLTKIMTAFLTIEALEPDKTVTIDDEVVGIVSKGANIDLKQGEKISVGDLTYAMLLPSANEAAVAAAKAVDGDVEKFVERMNEKAAALGTGATNFMNPNGLPEADHYTTARDMAIIARAAMKNEAFRTYAGTVRYTIPATNKSDARALTNGNKMFTETSDEISVYRHKRPIKFDGTTGIKLGYTEAAGYCIAAGAEREGIELIAVVLGAKENLQYADAEELLEYGFHNFKLVNAVEKGKELSDVTITNGTEDTVKAVAGSDLPMLTPLDGAGDDLRIEVRANKSVAAPVKKGDSIGTTTVYYKDVEIGAVDLVAASDVKATNMKRVFEGAGKVVSVIIKIVIALIGIFALWLIYSVISSAIRKRAKKKQKNFYGLPGYTSKEVKRIRKLR